MEFSIRQHVNPLNEEIDIKIGDVVRLKSGGPRMTVNRFGLKHDIQCVWFTFTDDLREGSFSCELLCKDIGKNINELRAERGLPPLLPVGAID